MASRANSLRADPKNTPIVFTARGLVVDVRLRCFETEFHVHSVILKLYSAFFAKFLDSSDKIHPQTVPAGRFKYEWASKVEDDGSWAFEAVTPGEKANNSISGKLIGKPKDHIKHFHMLLCALYGMPYCIQDSRELVTLTTLADYYCALPKLSSTVDALLLRSELGAFDKHLEDLFDCAFKLRQPELLRECAILMAGDWDHYNEHLSRCTNPTLQRILKRVRAGICEKIVAAQEACLGLVESDDQFATAYNKHHTDEDSPHSSMLAEHYRNLSEVMLDGDEENALDNLDELKELLGSNLRLKSNQGKDVAGRDERVNTFLCGELDDELPWDRNQLDW